MIAFIRILLDVVKPLPYWVLVFAACMIGVFIAYIGIALGVALFHPNNRRRRHAAAVLRQLLNFIRGQQ
jgi:hypothetical protein